MLFVVCVYVCVCFFLFVFYRLDELWSLLDFACGGRLLGDREGFAQDFSEPISDGSTSDASVAAQVGFWFVFITVVYSGSNLFSTVLYSTLI